MQYTFSYKVSDNKFHFYRNNEDIGIIKFRIEYNQIRIGWLCIKAGNLQTFESYYRRGYGTKMLKSFEIYISNEYPMAENIFLVPEYFDGKNKNNLCTFYEKSNYYQICYG